MAARDNALTLPLRSVHDILSGNPWVLGIKAGRASQRAVKIGLHGNSQVEIIDGLAAGDVAIPQSSGVLTGQRVRPVLQ